MENPSPSPQSSPSPASLPKGAVPVLAILLAAVSTAGLLYVGRESRREKELEAKNQALETNVNQLQSQLLAMNEKLAAMKTPAEPVVAPPPVPAPAPVVTPAPRVRATAARKTQKQQPPARNGHEDERWKQLESRVSKQQEDIASTRDQVEKTRSDLEGKLTSTRDDLNGSIARTHEEIVELQKRGERNYYEFDLAKKKDFQRVGPISLSLRKANTKRKSYDMALMVDDQQLQKKSVNLFEPLSIAAGTEAQPVNLVVTEITKDRVKGYVSEPRYQQSAAVAASAPAPSGLQRR